MVQFLLLPIWCALASPWSGAESTPQETTQDSSAASPAFQSSQAGFRIDKPHASWDLTTSPGDLGIQTLTMNPLGKGAVIQFKVTVSLGTGVDMDSLVAQRDALLDKVEDADEIHASRSLKMKIAGISAPGLQVDQEAGGELYTIRQVYLVAQGLQYHIQYHAPKEDFAKYRKAFETAAASFALVPLDANGQRVARMVALAARCGSEVDWLEEWDEASRRAKAEKKLIVVTVQAVTGFEVGDPIAQGPFMDLDIVRLLQHRYVVLRWRKGMGAPFEDAEVFGMGPSTFGSGMLVVTPKGEVVQQVFLLRATAVYDVLLEALSGHPKLSTPDPPQSMNRQETIAFLLHSGQLDEAEQWFTRPASASDPVTEAFLQGELHRLRREGPAALAAAKRGLAFETTPGTFSARAQQDLQLQLATLIIATGSGDAAAEVLAPLLDEELEIDPEIRAAAMAFRGVLHLQSRDRPASEAMLYELIDRFPASRYAWLAAAAITGPGWDIEVYPNLAWPDASRASLARIPDSAAKESRSMPIEEMVVSAADALLHSQLEDGSWMAMSSYGDTEALADDFELAATAICGRALLRLEEHPGARAAAERALQWLFQQNEILHGMEAPPVVFMDYAVWSRSYGIFFLADCLEAGIGEEGRVRTLMQEYLLDLQDRQQANGGWSYYLSGTAGGAAAQQSISFTTATVVLAFERAAALDAQYPKKVLERGLRCLEAMRSPQEHTFGYFLHGRNVEQGQRTSSGVEGSAARGPVCALALFRGGSETAKEMEPRMKLFVEHLPGFGEQRRKALMHAGSHAQGSHYLLFDYSTAAEALRETGKKGLTVRLRKQVREAILRELRACRNADGSFLDNPLMGVASGTGLALHALLDLKAME